MWSLVNTAKFFFDPLVTVLTGFHCIIMRREMIKQETLIQTLPEQ